jgi:hypothetical protein
MRSRVGKTNVQRERRSCPEELMLGLSERAVVHPSYLAGISILGSQATAVYPLCSASAADREDASVATPERITWLDAPLRLEPISSGLAPLDPPRRARGRRQDNLSWWEVLSFGSSRLRRAWLPSTTLRVSDRTKSPQAILVRKVGRACPELSRGEPTRFDPSSRPCVLPCGCPVIDQLP